MLPSRRGNAEPPYAQLAMPSRHLNAQQVSSHSVQPLNPARDKKGFDGKGMRHESLLPCLPPPIPNTKCEATRLLLVVLLGGSSASGGSGGRGTLPLHASGAGSSVGGGEGEVDVLVWANWGGARGGLRGRRVAGEKEGTMEVAGRA